MNNTNRRFNVFKIYSPEDSEIMEQRQRTISLYTARQKARERRKSLVQNQALGLTLFVSGIITTWILYNISLDLTVGVVMMGLGMAVTIVAAREIHNIDRIYKRR